MCCMTYVLQKTHLFLAIHTEIKLFPVNLIMLKAINHSSFLPTKMKILEDHITYTWCKPLSYCDLYHLNCFALFWMLVSIFNRFTVLFCFSIRKKQNYEVLIVIQLDILEKIVKCKASNHWDLTPCCKETTEFGECPALKLMTECDPQRNNFNHNLARP